MDYKNIVVDRIKEACNIDSETIKRLVEVPPKSDMGDYAFPCFALSKILRKAPNAIAEDILSKMDKDGFEKIETKGPYLNFFMDKSIFSKNTIEEIINSGDSYGRSEIGKGKNITIDFSSPNIAKPFHVGHLFSTAIGNSLYKMLSFEGYNCIGINHLGDWGTQFGKLISAYKRWCDHDELEKHPIKELLRIYVKFHTEAQNDPSLEDEGRMYFKKLEDGEEEEVKLWKKFRELSLKEFKDVYDLLNVKFDSYAGESFYNDKMDPVIDEIDKKGLLVESNGAKVVMLDDYNMPPCIIKKSDGATIYATRDLAAAEYRKKTYDFYKSIYVVGSDQILHFKQLFKTLELMGHEWSKDCYHVSFGMVRFADRKLSTRKGEVIFLDDLLNKSIAETLDIINEKNPELPNKEEVAKTVGVGAIVFTYLKNSREKDIVFNWEEMLSFEGETGPYVQYTYARAKSILRKLGCAGDKVDYSKLNTQEEFELVKYMEGFKNAIFNATEKLEPSILTRHIIDIAKAFNKFYNLNKISNLEDIELKNARLKLVESAAQVIKNGLSLLGINVVEKM
ncbi:MAG: arginine--tRNA ligase [Clostridium sp.]|nr:arginine--tRNA ligase [Clostridium sp.]